MLVKRDGVKAYELGATVSVPVFFSRRLTLKRLSVPACLGQA